MPDVSLITSLYKSEKFLPRYADNLLQVARDVHQAGIALEVVIIPNDAGEQERTILENLRQQIETEAVASIQLQYVPRETLYASWNRGFQNATGHAIGIWNVDDIRTAEGLIEGYRLLSGDVELVDFAFNIVTDHQTTRHEAEYNPQLLAPKTTLSPFWMCQRDLYLKAGQFNESFRICGDFEWCKRQLVREAQFTRSDVVAGEFYQHGSNLSGMQNKREWCEFNIALIWHGGEKHMRPVDPQVMYQLWQEWGKSGATVSQNTADWLWGAGAEERYTHFRRERSLWKPIRRIYLALAKLGVIHSVDWNLDHER